MIDFSAGKFDLKKFGVLEMSDFDDPTLEETILKLKLCEVEHRPEFDDYFIKLNDFTFFFYLKTQENIDYFINKQHEIVEINLAHFTEMNIRRDDGSKYIGYRHKDYWNKCLMKEFGNK